MRGNNAEGRPAGVRDVALLPGERAVEMFSGRDGLVKDPQHQTPLAALTDRRLLLFAERDSQEETVMASLEYLQGAVVRTPGRSWKPLFQGLALVVMALLAYLIIGNFVVKEGVLIPAIVGGVIGAMGIYMLLRYMFSEDEGSITFQGNGWAFSFPYQTRHHDDALTFLGKLFAAKSAMQQAAAGREAVAPPPSHGAPQPLPASSAGNEGTVGDPADVEQQLAEPGVGDDVQT